MNVLSSKLVSMGLLFLFIFLSGFWLSRTGKPYSTLILTVHKLIGLAAGVYLVIRAYRTHQTVPLNPAGISALVFTVFIFIVLVATGGLLSAGKSMPVAVSVIHKFFPYLAALSTGVMIYLLS